MTIMNLNINLFLYFINCNYKTVSIIISKNLKLIFHIYLLIKYTIYSIVTSAPALVKSPFKDSASSLVKSLFIT
jgi:hypothetical protein